MFISSGSANITIMNFEGACSTNCPTLLDDGDFRRMEQMRRESEWLTSIRWAAPIPIQRQIRVVAKYAALPRTYIQHRGARELRKLHPL